MKKNTYPFPCPIVDNLQYHSDEFSAELQQFLVDLTFLYRDVSLEPKTLLQYQIGRLFREPNLLIATNKFGGLMGNTRFLIITAAPHEITNLAEHIEWGLCMLERNQLFKIIDMQSVGECHQITLIHITHNFDHFFRSIESTRFESQLHTQTRSKFIQACGLAPLEELSAAAWKERTAWPLGLNNEGHLLLA